jgi:hypothetical protein
MALNISLDIRFDKMRDWKGIQEKAGEVNSTKAYVVDDETAR